MTQGYKRHISHTKEDFTVYTYSLPTINSFMGNAFMGNAHAKILTPPPSLKFNSMIDGKITVKMFWVDIGS